MSELLAQGLDGANPLHALAAFGLLRLGDRLQPGLRLGWQLAQGAWRPVFSPLHDAESFRDMVATALANLAELGLHDPALGTRGRKLSAETKKLRDQLKKAEKAAKADAKTQKLDREAAKAFVNERLAETARVLAGKEYELQEAQAALASSNGPGVAHLGDIISVDAGVFRDAGAGALASWRTGRTATVEGPDDPALIITQLPALACDQILGNGKVIPTPFSFSNGSGGQCLLKDFRACAAAVTLDRLTATLEGQEDANVADRTGLNWDPTDQVSYALVWRNPEKRVKNTDVAANALAYLGLSLLPCVPGGRHLAAVGWDPSGAFIWPIWRQPLSVDAVGSLLAAFGSLSDLEPAALRARGIEEVRCARKINPDGKRNFFAPSRPVA